MVHPDHREQSGEEGGRSRLVGDGGNSRLDRILEGLSRPRSRHVLYSLAEEEPRDIDAVAAAVADLEADSAPTDAQRKAVKTDLYHNVLPKLSNAMLVEYDSRSEAIRFRDPPPELEEFLTLCRALDLEG